METVLYKIHAWVDKHGKGYRIIKGTYKETGKSYSGYGQRISKDKLMKADTFFIETHNIIRYFTYCLEGDQQKALDLLKNHINSKVKKYKDEIDLIVSILSNGKEEEIEIRNMDSKLREFD